MYKNVQEAARAALVLFRQKENKLVLDKPRPEWVYTMVYEAHCGMLPDDYKYEYVTDALRVLGEASSPDNARECIESDVYTSDLLHWLASNTTRLGYCDDAVDEYMVSSDATMETRLSYGQYYERCEVFDVVLAALEEQVTP